MHTNYSLRAPPPRVSPLGNPTETHFEARARARSASKRSALRRLLLLLLRAQTAPVRAQLRSAPLHSLREGKGLKNENCRQKKKEIMHAHM